MALHYQSVKTKLTSLELKALCSQYYINSQNFLLVPQTPRLVIHINNGNILCYYSDINYSAPAPIVSQNV